MFSFNLNGYLQFLAVLLLGLGIVTYYKFKDWQQPINQIRAIAWSRQDSLHIEQYRTDYIQHRDSLIYIEKLTEIKKNVRNSDRTGYNAALDELNLLYRQYDSSFKQHELTSYLNDRALERINELDRESASEKWSEPLFPLILIAIALSGVVFVLVRMNKQYNLSMLQKNYEMYKQGIVHLFCQSCGQNFSSVRPNGTDLNGSRNFSFCDTCYQNGQFTDPSLKRVNVKSEFLKEMRKTSNKKERKRLLDRFRSLERWKNDTYGDISFEKYFDNEE